VSSNIHSRYPFLFIPFPHQIPPPHGIIDITERSWRTLRQKKQKYQRTKQAPGPQRNCALDKITRQPGDSILDEVNQTKEDTLIPCPRHNYKVPCPARRKSYHPLRPSRHPPAVAVTVISRPRLAQKLPVSEPTKPHLRTQGTIRT
jgi:hypothetical protein